MNDRLALTDELKLGEDNGDPIKVHPELNSVSSPRPRVRVLANPPNIPLRLISLIFLFLESHKQPQATNLNLDYIYASVQKKSAEQNKMAPHSYRNSYEMENRFNSLNKQPLSSSDNSGK